MASHPFGKVAVPGYFARMSRLPPAPDLDWKPDGTPVARGFGDVYFSTSDGLEETRTVFLKGCGLPDRWQGRSAFTIAETGFGTGLNFLAAWQLWRQHRPSASAWLHFASFEGYLLQVEDAARALAAWPELSGLSGQLLARWPDRALGVRQIGWPEDGVTLTLFIDDIAAALPGATFLADAWFLDGFSPARNEDMWSPALYPEIAARSAPGAVAASFTVARKVRDGLADAGFEPVKRPGHGRKRDRLEALFRGEPARQSDPFGLRAPARQPEKVAILGAGIAGASLARALTERGLCVTVFDPEGPAAGASGNPLALLMPRLDTGNTVQARVLIDAYLHARRAYAGRAGTEGVEVRQPPRGADERDRFARLLADPPLPLEDLEALADGGLLHKQAMILRPQRLIRALLDGIDTRFGEAGVFDAHALTVNGEAFDAIVLATGPALDDAAPWLGLVGKLGQVEWVGDAPAAPPSAMASGEYALATGTERLWGATFQTHSGAPETSVAAQQKNLEGLTALSPWWVGQVRGKESVSRAGVRATMPDRLPVVGALPDFEACLESLAPLRAGAEADSDAPLIEGVYLLGGLGSRGFTFAPYLAACLAAQLAGSPRPATQAGLEAISPMRMIRRGLKRRLF